MTSAEPGTIPPGQAAGVPRATIGVREVLRIRDYRSLFGGQVISDIGDGITMLLALLVINHFTGSTAAVAGMAIAEALPALTVGLIAGAYVDRWDRRRTMIVSDLARAGIVSCFMLVQTPALVPLLYALGFVQAGIASFFRPARGALLPHIVPRPGLPAANSLAQASQVIGGVVGAGIAGALFGVFGLGWVGFVLDAATFLASAALVSRVTAAAGRIDPAGTSRTSTSSSVIAGLKVVTRSRVLSGMAISLAVTMLGLGAVNVLFVPLVVNLLRVSPTWMAGIDAAQTAGMLIAAALVTTLARRLAPTTIVTLGLVGVGTGIAAVAGVTAVWQLLVVMLLVGLMVTPMQAMVSTIAQTSVPDDMRGRVGSVVSAVIASTSIASMAIGGLLGDLVGIRIVCLASGILVLTAAAIAWSMFRGIDSRGVDSAAATAQPGAEPAPA